MDPSLLLGGTALLGPTFGRAPAALTAGAVVMLWLLAGRTSRGRLLAWGLVALLVGLATGVRAHLASTRMRAAAAAWDARMPRIDRCAFEGELVLSPVRRAGRDRLIVATRRLTCEVAGEVEGDGARIALAVVPTEPFARGDQVAGLADLATPERFWNEELGDPWTRLAASGIHKSGGALFVERTGRRASIPSYVDRARAHVRDRIEATFPSAAAPMARALVLGESDLAAEDDDAFRTSGLSHLLAVSGMHLVLVVLSLERALAALLRKIGALAARTDPARFAAAVALAGAWLYADFAGGSGSAVRAAWMLSVALAARAFGRRARAARALGLSTLAAALASPFAAFDVSFTLSLAATAGLMGLGPAVGRVLAVSEAPSILGATARAVGSSLAASIACAPLVLGLGPTVPLGGLFANLIAVPLGEVAALPLCIVHTMVGFAPPLERGAAFAASGALLAVRGVARHVAALPWASLALPPPTPAELVAIACALTAAVIADRRRAWVVFALSAAVVGAAECAAIHAGSPRGELRVTTLDVGQGDAHLVDLPDGSAMLIDAGGLVGSPLDVGARVLAPVLRSRRRSALAVVVLSHPHPDHYGGLATGTAAVTVAELWDTGQAEAEGASGALAATNAVCARGAVRRGPDVLCGVHAVGGAIVEVLAPCPGFDPDHGPNDNSFVLRVRYGARSILFVGDAERDLESRVMERTPPAALRADVLKVGHHGSATSSSPAFVAGVAPAIAVVSVGARNRFGHPRAATLATLGAAGIDVFRTDREGAVVVTTDGVSLGVRAASGRAAALYSAAPE